MNGRKIFLLSLLLAIIATVIFALYINPSQPTDAVQIEMAEIIVAKQDIPKDAVITEEMLVKKQYPKETLPAGAQTNVEFVVNRVAQENILANEPIVESRLADPKQTSSALAYKVPEGKRAISISYNDVLGVAGHLRPGDYVDVISVISIKDNASQEEQPTARILLQDIMVLAIGNYTPVNLTGEEVKIAPATTITLLVTPQEAEVVAFNEANGKSHLILRGVNDRKMATTRGVTYDNLFNIIAK